MRVREIPQIGDEAAEGSQHRNHAVHLKRLEAGLPPERGQNSRQQPDKPAQEEDQTQENSPIVQGIRPQSEDTGEASGIHL